MGIDIMIRKHPECGVIITGDFNQLNDHFLKVHYRFVQVVNVVTPVQATLDKIWTNMNGLYSTPVSITELGMSDHCMVLWKPDRGSPDIRGNVTRVTVKCMGPSEKAAFAMGVASIRWEPLFRLTTCEEKHSYYQTIVNSLMEHCFAIKTVTRHTADKPWITDLFRNLIRKRQRAYKSGNRDEYRVLRKGGFILSTPSSALTRFHTPLKCVEKRFAAYLFILFTRHQRASTRVKKRSSAQDAAKFNGAELSRFTPANASNSANHLPVSRIEFAADQSCNYVRELALDNQLVVSES